jgi:hypothetical protein
VLLEVLDELDALVVLEVLDELDALVVLDELALVVLLEELDELVLELEELDPPSGWHASATSEVVNHLPAKHVTISFGTSLQMVLHSNTLSHCSPLLNGQLTLPPELDELLDALVLDELLVLLLELEELDPPSALHASATSEAATHLPP